MGIFNKKTRLTQDEIASIREFAEGSMTFTQGELIEEFKIYDFKKLNEVLALSFLEGEDCGCGNETEINYIGGDYNE